MINHNSILLIKEMERVISSIFIISYLFISTSAVAQEAPEYRMEIGGGAGMMNYLGDLNGNLLKNMQPTGGVVAKYKLNPRMAWGAWLGYGKMKGEWSAANTWYPEITVTQREFTSTVVDFNVRFEYNFWPFGTGREYLGARRLTPFIALGAGLVFAKADHGSQTGALQMPIGVGVKYKLKDRLNLAVDWMMHITGSDKLDGIDDPYGIKSTGMFKNTDCYGMITVSLTYDFWERCKTCHNDRD